MGERTDQPGKAVRIIVRGRVQGVWYRAHTEKKARELGLSGYVKNLPDGSVEIVADGDPADVDQLAEWTWTGSPHSSVEAVEIEAQPATRLPAFSTRY